VPRALPRILLTALLCAPAFAQTAKFEIADVQAFGWRCRSIRWKCW
jgi:hypothetical protein